MHDQTENVDVANAVDIDEANFLSDSLVDPTPTEPKRDANGRFVAQEPEPTPEPAPEPEAQVQERAPAHSPRMLRMAADLGISEDDAADYTTDQLEAVIHERHKQLVAHTRRPKPVEPLKVEAEPEIAFGIDEEAFPELVTHLRSEAKTRKALEAKLAQLEERESKREQAAQVSQLDQAFHGHPEFFGSETVDELAGNDPKMLRRQAAITIMKMDASNKPLKKKLEAAMAVLNFTPPAKPTNGVDKDLVYGDKDVQKQRKTDTAADDIGGRLNQRKAEWSEAGLAAPTARHPAKEVPGLATAKKAFIEEARAAGLKVNSNYDPEDENFEP